MTRGPGRCVEDKGLRRDSVSVSDSLDMAKLEGRFAGSEGVWLWPSRLPTYLGSVGIGLRGEPETVGLRDRLCSRLVFELDEKRTLGIPSGIRVLLPDILHELRSWRFECFACFSIELDCRIPRSSTHCATGKRCLPDRARIIARVS